MKKLLLSAAFCIALALFATAQTLQKTKTPANQDPFANKKIPRAPKSATNKNGRQKKAVQFLMPVEESTSAEKKTGKQ